MASKVTVSDNQINIPVRVSTKSTQRSVSEEQFDPFYVGAEAKVEQLEDGALVTCKDKSGTTTARIYDGTDGQDGYSPTIDVDAITGGHRVTITDAEQTQTFDVMDGEDGETPEITAEKVGDTTTVYVDGEPIATITDGQDGADGQDGQDGQDGADGFSPIASVSKVGDTATITITDKQSTTTASISDGVDGQDGRDGVDGQDGRDGVDGQDGYSPSASVTKSGGTATITITDKDGTTTASISDGGGASAFVAEFNVTTYADVKDAYDNDAILVCTVDDSGNPKVLQLVYFDVANEIFYFAFPTSEGWYLTELSNADGWGDGQFYFASTDVATQLRDGLMSALDKQKLDGLLKRNIWYGTSSTSASSSPKTITTASGDFELTAGSMLVVLFSHANSLSSASLQVDGGTAKAAYPMDGTSDISNRWGSNELVMFAYDGTKFIMLEQGKASTTAYGITKLNNTTSSTSTSEAATANAVKAAYDNGGVQSVNGSTGAVSLSIHNVPSGGTSGQVLSKASGTDYDLAWSTPSSVTSTSTPTASTIAEFDASAHMNSTDMTSQEVQDFIDSLQVGGGGTAVDLVVEQGTGYRKWNSGNLECWGITAFAANASHARCIFPTNFANTDYTAIGIIQGSPITVTGIGGKATGYVDINTSTSSYARNMAWYAIGKWK